MTNIVHHVNSRAQSKCRAGSVMLVTPPALHSQQGQRATAVSAVRERGAGAEEAVLRSDYHLFKVLQPDPMRKEPLRLATSPEDD